MSNDNTPATVRGADSSEGLGGCAAAPVDLRQIAERAGISMDCWDTGAASMAYTEGCHGIARAQFEKFAALYGFACWSAARDLDLQIRAALEAPQWRPIETAPHDGTAVWAYRATGGVHGVAYRVPRDDCEMWHFNGTSADVANRPDIKPTHWMPLPEPPNAVVGVSPAA